jgi:hypothetical protein
MTSTIKADIVVAATGTNTDLTLQGKGTGVVNLSAGSKLNGVALTDTFSTQSPANPNLIINGDMRIAQRGTSFTGIAGANPYTLDRWQFKANGLVEGVYSVAQETSVVPAKFSSALKATCTTAEVTAGASYRASLRYSVEGYDASDLDWGSAEAQQVTISFKVRSSLIGTYCVALSNGTRTIRKEYTISVADTWEEKTLTFAGDTTGTWAVNNTQGVEVQFALGVGANLNAGTDNTWETNDDIATASQVDWGGTLNATFYLTGVKLEVGSTATAFVPDNYGTALAKCQRYFCKTYIYEHAPGTATSASAIFSNADSTSAAGPSYGLMGYFSYPVYMRTSPTLTTYGVTTGSLWYNMTTGGSLAVGTLGNGNRACTLVCTAAPSTGVSYSIQATADAEL